MSFVFHERTKLEICGRQYEMDLMDSAFIETVVLDFLGIQGQYQVLEALQQELTGGLGKAGVGADVGTIAPTEEQVLALSRRLAEENQTLLALGRSFLEHALGEEAYQEIFAGRRPNSVDHLELCAYVYRTALEGREEVVRGYVLPNRESRRSNQGSRKAKQPAQRADHPAAKPLD